MCLETQNRDVPALPSSLCSITARRHSYDLADARFILCVKGRNIYSTNRRGFGFQDTLTCKAAVYVACSGYVFPGIADWPLHCTPPLQIAAADLTLQTSGADPGYTHYLADLLRRRALPSNNPLLPWPFQRGPSHNRFSALALRAACVPKNNVTIISRTRVLKLFASVPEVWSRRAEAEDRGCEMRVWA